MAEMARSTRVVCSTVGPYAKYGSALVAACAATGTHYCDLTGEAHWMQRMIDAHHDEARATGARIVFTCGFDCIPSDLGAWFLQREMRARQDVACARIAYRVKGFSGAASGGTLASGLNMFEEAARDPSIMRAMNDPYALNPRGERAGPDPQEGSAPVWDARFDQWTAPFIMGAINTKVVRRSNALLDYAYGRDFRYDEAMLMGSGPGGFAKAVAASVGMAAMQAALKLGPVRKLAAARAPASGEGPTRAQQEKGYFDILLYGEHPDGPERSLRGRVTGDRDPGYGSTSKMLSESALCLARDPLTSPGGMSTPAAAMGEALLVRLEKHAGIAFTIQGD
jgi:short subunit dehydrogenase-like uncharacterized protein